MVDLQLGVIRQSRMPLSNRGRLTWTAHHLPLDFPTGNLHQRAVIKGSPEKHHVVGKPGRTDTSKANQWWGWPITASVDSYDFNPRTGCPRLLG